MGMFFKKKGSEDRECNQKHALLIVQNTVPLCGFILVHFLKMAKMTNPGIHSLHLGIVMRIRFHPEVKAQLVLTTLYPNKLDSAFTGLRLGLQILPPV